MAVQYSRQVAAVREAKHLFENTGIGAVTVDGPRLQPAQDIIVVAKIQRHPGHIQRQNMSVADLRHWAVSTHQCSIKHNNHITSPN